MSQYYSALDTPAAFSAQNRVTRAVGARHGRDI
jgi:hypothetical protein